MDAGGQAGPSNLSGTKKHKKDKPRINADLRRSAFIRGLSFVLLWDVYVIISDRGTIRTHPRPQAFHSQLGQARSACGARRGRAEGTLGPAEAVPAKVLLRRTRLATV